MKGKRLRKRFVSLMLAGIMFCPSVTLTNVPPVTVQAADESAKSGTNGEKIVSGTENERSTRLAMTNNQAVITVEAITSGSFRTSVVDGTKYITTVTDGNSWYDGDGASGNNIYYEKGTAGDGVIQGHIYEVRYTRSGSSYTIEYYDVSRDASLYKYHADKTGLTGNNVDVYAKAVEGTYRVYNCAAQEAGFKAGDYSEYLQEVNHGRNRERRVEAPDNTVPDGYDVNPDTQGSAKDGAYDKYFLKDSLQEVRVTMKADNLDYVLQNADYKEYALAESATIGDKTVENVGLKVKGNYTRYLTDLAGNDRFSFTINFGKYVKKKGGYTETQNFFGCQKISFNNFVYDKTMMKEYTALRLLTEMGLPTPQYGLAKLYINDEYYGVYFMLEAMDSSILEQYYNTSSKNLSDFLTKPSYYSPRFYPGDFENDIIKDGVITWDELVQYGYIVEYENGTYTYDNGLEYYSGLWENDDETFQDVVQELPTVLTWMYRLTMLSSGKDFLGNKIDVNSQAYLDLLGQVMDVDETVKYFATHSFLLQQDNLFTNRQNYALYVNKTGQSVMVPWDYDLAWGCYGDPADGESVANWNIDKLYNDMMSYMYPYTDELDKYYGGNANGDIWDGYGSGYPLFNVIYQNDSLMEKFHTYMEDCSKIASLGGTTSTGNYYEAGRFSATIDSLRGDIEAAASEPLPENISYLQYDQPNDVKRGLTGLKQVIALRSVGVWLQVNGINAKVTGYGYETGSLGNDNDNTDEVQYTTGGNNIAVVDDATGIFTVANYATAGAGPELTAAILKEDSAEYQAVKAKLLEVSPNAKTLTVYTLNTTKQATSNYDVYLPAPSKDAVVYSYSAAGGLTKLEASGDCTKKVTVSELSCFAVADDGYEAQFAVDDGVESIDVFYTHDYDNADETNVTSVLARNDETGAIDKNGEGQINFKVNLKDGYKIKSVKADNKDNYKNKKTPAETEGENVYRFTKITGDLAITVKTEKATQYDVTFNKKDGVASIDVYSAQTLAEPDEEDVTETIVRSKTGAVDVSGAGQVNFRVNLEEGRMVDEITISGGNYNQIKLPGETGKNNVYRVTRVSGDIEIKVTTKEYVAQYDATFEKDDGVSSIDIYHTQDYTTPNDTNVITACARSSQTGDVDTSGGGQINFKVNLKDGYAVKSVTVTEEANYKNLKGKEETLVDDVYRITKITGNLTVKIVTEKKPASESQGGTVSSFPTDGLIGYYGFEDSLSNTAFKNSGTAKLHSGATFANGNWNKAATGTASYDAGGKIGKAYSFAGGTGEGLELDVKMPEAFTIAYWVKPNQVTNYTSMVFSPVGSVGFDGGLNISNNFGGNTFPTVRAWSSEVSDEPGGTFLDKWGDALCNEWTHIAVTCDADGKMTLYVNGIRGESKEIKKGALKDSPLYLGINYWDPTFDGLMDEVYIYNKALTVANVQAVYKSTKNFEPSKNSPTTSNTSNGSGTLGGSGTQVNQTQQDASITCNKTLYKVAYGAKAFKINATSKGKLTFTSSKPKIASVDKNTGKVTIKGTGTAVITVQTGKKTVKVTVKVSPKKMKIKSVKPAKGKKLTVKWAKDKNATGYQVQISTTKKFKKIVQQKTLSKNSITFKKLKAGKKYYVRIRSYKKSGSEKLYSAWSSAKKSNAVKK